MGCRDSLVNDPTWQAGKAGGSTKHLSKTTQEVQGSLSQHKGGGIKPAAAMRWSLRGWGWVGNCGVVGSQLCYII